MEGHIPDISFQISIDIDELSKLKGCHFWPIQVFTFFNVKRIPSDEEGAGVKNTFLYMQF